MGNGVIREAPDYDNFRKFSEEYDKLKSAGLSAQEMHGILCHRLKSMTRTASGPAQPAVMIVDDFADRTGTGTGSGLSTSIGAGGKEDAVRGSETTNTNTSNNNNNNRKTSFINSSVSMKHPQGKQQQQPQQQQLSAEPEHNGLVLLIDDSPVAAKVASKVLLQLHFEVVIANSAKMGFDILMNRKDEVDLIFLDVVMPTVDGVECLSWIKDNADVAHIPVYMLSGLEDQMLMDVCVERGAEGMLLKPLNPEMVKFIMNSHNLGKTVAEPTTTNQQISNSKPAIAQSLSLIIPKNDMESKSVKLPGKKATNNTLVVGSQAPAFKLVDSDFNEYVFPNPNSRKNVLLLFIPTIFCTVIFEETGFLMRFFGYYEQLVKSNTLFVACVSADLPYAQKAAKKRFKLPFALLSDPSLYVAQRFVGSMDIGSLMTKLESSSNTNNKSDQSYDHPQNSFVGPSIGMILLNRKRDVLNKWVAPGNLFDNRQSVQQGQFPENFDEWVSLSQELGSVSPRKAPTETISRVESESVPEGKEEMIKSAKQDSKPSVQPPSSVPLEQDNSKSKPSSSVSSKPNILVVDDSSVSSRVCSKKLELLGFNVVTAYNGQQAFDQLKKKPTSFFSMILSDVVMPVCDGIGLLKLLKSSTEFKLIPIVMMSGLEGEELSKSCLDLGANALLKKPFDDAKFLEAIKGFNII